MSKVILIGVTVASLLFCFFLARSKYTLMKIRVTSPILRPATLAGTVVASSGSAVAGVRVSLVPQPDNQYDLPVVRTNSDANGDFTFARIFPARYRLVATTPSDQGSTQNAGMNITLAEGEHRKVNLHLDGALNQR